MLEEVVIPGSDVLDIKDEAEVAKRLRVRVPLAARVIAAPRSPTLSTLQGTISSKQYGCEDLITRLVAKACIDVCPKNSNNFNVDNVRVCKVRPPRRAARNTAGADAPLSQITGGGLSSSSVVQGLVVKRDTEGTVKRVEKAKARARRGCTLHAAPRSHTLSMRAGCGVWLRH